MKLKRQFYNRPTLDVAKDLLGKNLVHYSNGEILMGKIVEVEAYIGAIDKAAHSYNNKITERTKVMFGPPGHAYVYLIYGMYNCMNVVTQMEGEAAAVLVRAVEPIEGINIMAHNRYGKSTEELTKKQIINLTSGPGKLCMAMGITKLNNSMDLCGDILWIEDSNEDNVFEVVTTTRINIDYAEEAIDFPWRFYIKDNPFISKK
ncbi:DNA-3-methyladenine glycosylase [Alkaliphilus sp. B6464]|nr:DNA-3-methyladenine glycosylase [Alkaliphilus sp. B6464]QUH21706.1 DNA-3-methyladenine glycosylase [Alkaliphilus sp. B6464]